MILRVFRCARVGLGARPTPAAASVAPDFASSPRLVIVAPTLMRLSSDTSPWHLLGRATAVQSVEGMQLELQGVVRLPFEHVGNDAAEPGRLSRCVFAGSRPFRCGNHDPVVSRGPDQLEGMALT